MLGGLRPEVTIYIYNADEDNLQKYFALVQSTSPNKKTIQNSDRQKSSGANTRKNSTLNIIYLALVQPRIYNREKSPPKRSGA
jgi:hypothetical protein